MGRRRKPLAERREGKDSKKSAGTTSEKAQDPEAQVEVFGVEDPPQGTDLSTSSSPVGVLPPGRTEANMVVPPAANPTKARVVPAHASPWANPNLAVPWASQADGSGGGNQLLQLLKQSGEKSPPMRPQGSPLMRPQGTPQAGKEIMNLVRAGGREFKSSTTGPLELSTDEFLMSQHESRQDAERGADRHNLDTFGEAAAAGGGAWDYESMIEANRNLTGVDFGGPSHPGQNASVPVVIRAHHLVDQVYDNPAFVDSTFQ